jgi:hypothetical protein
VGPAAELPRPAGACTKGDRARNETTATPHPAAYPSPPRASGFAFGSGSGFASRLRPSASASKISFNQGMRRRVPDDCGGLGTPGRRGCAVGRATSATGIGMRSRLRGCSCGGLHPNEVRASRTPANAQRRSAGALSARGRAGPRRRGGSRGRPSTSLRRGATSTRARPRAALEGSARGGASTCRTTVRMSTGR